MISVAEVWLPQPDSIEDANEVASEYVKEITRVHLSNNLKIIDEAAEHVKYAENPDRTALPGWAVTSSATYGSPPWEVIA